jgi:hypothetical protein
VTTETRRTGDPHEQASTPDRKDFTMAVDLLQRLPGKLRRTESGLDLITCALCLRVRRESEWVQAERLIREIRSYELEAPPRLQSGVCDDCADTIFSRRALGEAVAA